MNVDAWGHERLADLATVVELAMPNEGLAVDEIEACCFDDDSVVLACGDGGVAVACVRDGSNTVHVQLLAVVPAMRRLGVGRTLLDAAVGWGREHGARDAALGAGAPFYLWPGVDVRSTGMLTLAESAGFHAVGAELNMGAVTSFRAPVPDGVEVRRVLDDVEAIAVLALTDRHWQHWVPEVARGVENGACFAAHADGAPVAFACHSVNRVAWVGPIATDPAWQHRGIAAALMGEVCRDLAGAGHAVAEIAWVGPVGFYANTMGANVSRVFRTYRRSLR